MSETTRRQPDRLMLGALIIGAAMLIAAGVVSVLTSQPFLRSHLIAVLYWLGVSLGAMGWLMVWRLTGGAWGDAIAPRLAGATRALPVMALLFAPLLVWPGSVYDWADAHGEHGGTGGHGMQPHYLTTPFFIVRAVIYFAVWMALGAAVTMGVSAQRAPDVAHQPRALTRLSAAGIILYVLLMSFAAIDWGMSLDREWVSTIYGLLFVVGQAMASLCIVIMAATWPAWWERGGAEGDGDEDAVLSGDALHDVGKLLITTVALWAYLNFSQLLIYWAGNVPVEITWYTDRMGGFWGGVMGVLIIGHFFAPFIVLLSRDVKRSPRWLFVIAAYLLVMHFVDLAWRIAPSLGRDDAWPVALDLLATLGVGGLWLAAYRWQRRRMQRVMTPHTSPAPAAEGGAT